jgi:hypothetical protein
MVIAMNPAPAMTPMMTSPVSTATAMLDISSRSQLNRVLPDGASAVPLA